MKRNTSHHWKKYAVIIASLIVVITSFILGFHNATLYETDHGFDGSGHTYYIDYLYRNRKMPPPTEWETHQPPLYYIIGALVMSTTGSIKTPQYMNIFILWLIIGMVGLGIWKTTKNKTQTLVGMLSLASLPMLNIFPAMVTNELLNTFWIISAAVAAIFFYKTTSQRDQIKSAIWLGISLVLGVWTKVSIIFVLPTLVITLVLSIIKKQIPPKRLLTIFLAITTAFIVAYYPVYHRASTSIGPSNVGSVASRISLKRPLSFFIRLDWIPKVDMYNTQYYSFLGGAWNSFWSDGHNAITPFVPFHKKAFILWSLGFILLPICLYGHVLIWRKNRHLSLIINTLGVSMLLFYLLYNMVGTHYSAARLTYQMGIVLPYAFGIAAAATHKRLKPIIIFLLAIQFVILVSFYWILPWWAQANKL